MIAELQQKWASLAALPNALRHLGESVNKITEAWAADRARLAELEASALVAATRIAELEAALAERDMRIAELSAGLSRPVNGALPTEGKNLW